MSRPIVVIVCMGSSSESWEPYQRPHPWHSRAGGGAVHSINNGRCENSLNNLVGAGEQRWRNSEAERLCSFQIDEQIEFARLFHRQIARVFTLKNAGDIVRCPIVHGRGVRS